jgi:ClpP class serine protease
MEEQLIQMIGSYGVIGIAGAILFKRFLSESSADKEYFRSEIKDMREEAKKDRQMFQEELDKSRGAFLESIDKITDKMSSLEEEVKEIRETLTRGD